MWVQRRNLAKVSRQRLDKEPIGNYDPGNLTHRDSVVTEVHREYSRKTELPRKEEQTQSVAGAVDCTVRPKLRH